MSLQEEIAELRQGKIDLDEFKTRINDQLLPENREQVMELLQTLHESNKQGDLADDDYEELTQFVGDTISPAEGADDAYTQLVADETSTGEIDLSTTVRVGMRLRDRFILDEVVGVGGMGTVYRGRDELKLEARDRDPHVAIKVLNDTFKKRPEAFIALQREASRQQRLAHPNICTVYDFDRSDGLIFITMEFLKGRTLDRVIKEEAVPQQGLPLEKVLPIVEGICSALHFAHERNIVHADFKPGNCIIDDDHKPKVLDFGIARAVQDPHAPQRDQTLFDARTIGALTPAYASFEMLTNSDEPDARDDIYAVGCVTYELLTGKHPFHRIPADQAKANGLEPKRIPSLSRRQNDALKKALAFDRADRTPSVMQFFEELSDTSANSGVKLVAGAVLVAALAGLALWVPSYLADQQYDAAVSLLRSGDLMQVEEGFATLAEMGEDVERRALQENRQQLLSFYSGLLNQFLDAPNEVLDFSATDNLLQRATAHYPDSAILTDLSRTYEQRRNAYLGTLSSEFDKLLTADSLLADPSKPDLPELLQRILEIDNTNPLLKDPRTEGAYADAARAAMEAEDYTNARRLIDTGLELVGTPVELVDINDRLVVQEQAIELARQIEEAEQALADAVAGVSRLNALEQIRGPLDALIELAPDHPAVAQNGRQLRERFATELETYLQAERLAQVDEFMAGEPAIWQQLKQDQLVAAVSARRELLLERQNNLIAQSRNAIRSSTLETEDGIGLDSLLTRLTAINAQDPRIAELRKEAVTEMRARAQRLSQALNWDEARQTLAQARPFAQSAELDAALAADFKSIDTLEAQQNAAIEELARQEELDRQAALQRAEEERRRTQELARQQAINDALAAVEQSITAVRQNTLQRSIQAVRARRAELTRLQPDHSALGRLDVQLQTKVIEIIEDVSDTQQALALAAEAEAELGSYAALNSIVTRLELAREAESAAARRQAIAQARSNLASALAPGSLESSRGREVASQALQALVKLVPEERTVLSTRVADAYAQAAAPLIAAQRFSAAQAILDTATKQLGDHPTLRSSRTRLADARQAFEVDRKAREQEAQLAALQERFGNELKAGQLQRAAQTLKDYRSLDNRSAFAQTESISRLSAAYAARITQQIKAYQLSDATASLQEARQIASTDPRWAELENNVQVARLVLRVNAWFADQSDRNLTSIRSYMNTIREADTSGYRALQNDWTAIARKTLDAKASDAKAYNVFLTDARTLLPDSGLSSLALKTIPEKAPTTPERKPEAPQRTPTPTVEDTPTQIVTRTPREPPPQEKAPVTQPSASGKTLADISGHWCGDGMQLQFTADVMTFTVRNQQLEYPVTEYVFTDDLIRVNWKNRRTNMEFEFGSFSATGRSMLQIRGRESGGNWQNYNRKFNRCN